MKTIHNTKIIGIDHGYGNMKTANCCFPTGITAYDHEPLFTADMLVYGGRYYLTGEGHKEFAPDKIKDEDYYVLTLAAIAKELKAENLTEAHIVIAAGLPLTWTSGQKADFKEYLMKNAEVEFSYVAQIAVFSAEAEPIWRRNKISPQAARMRFSVSVSRFSLCPAGCVSRYNKQGLCVPQKSPSQPESADSLGAQPPIPRKERCAWGKMFVSPSA